LLRCSRSNPLVALLQLFSMVRLPMMATAAALRPSGGSAPVLSIGGPSQGGSSEKLGAVAMAVATATDKKQGGSGPATLQAYCEGEPEPSQRGQRVEANWRDYGTFYPGKVKKIHRDGTTDILYDDGWHEDGLDPSDVRPLEDEPKKPRDDAACDVADNVVTIKTKISQIRKDIQMWLASRRARYLKAKRKKTRAAGSPYVGGAAAVAAAAPSPAVAGAPAPGGLTSDDLEKLKKRLADVDKEIEEVGKEVAENDKLLQKERQDDAAVANGQPMLTIDDLLAEYRERIRLREEELKKLKERREQQERELAAVGAEPIDLETIAHDVTSFEEELEAMMAKREKLEREGRLDPELRMSIDALVKEHRNLKKRVEELQQVARKADAKEKAAAKAAAVAAAEARAQGESEATAKEAAMAAALEGEDPEDEVFKAADSLEKELKSASESTDGLDTGVHPNGEKWWRYRYEHSFVEAVLMIFITLIMMLWESLVKWIHAEVWRRSSIRRYDVLTHGTMYIHWLESSMGELVACLLVYLTVWVLSHCGVFDLLPRILHSGDAVHLPTTGLEYRRLCFDICVVLFSSIIFYFALSLALVEAATKKMHKWAEMDAGRHVAEDASPDDRRPSLRAMSIAASANDYAKLKAYFMFQVKRMGMDSIDNIAFWKYLRLNVRMTVDSLFAFGPLIWIPITVTFAILSVLHYVGHLTFISIMTGFMFVICLNIALMAWVVHSVNRNMNAKMEAVEDEDSSEASEQEQPEERAQTPRSGSRKKSDEVTELATVKVLLSFLMHYTIFFLCYGASRAICQPWMWKLHFWLALFATVLTLTATVIFVFVIAPMIPTFAASLSLPPYMDKHNITKLKMIAEQDTTTAADFRRMGSAEVVVSSTQSPRYFTFR